MAQTLQNGINLVRQGDLEGAEKVFLSLLEAHPEDSSARMWLGECYVLVGDLGKAQTAFRMLVSCEDASVREEAKKQLRALRFNRVLHFLVVNPPLRWLLLFSVIGYGVSWGLRAASIQKSAAWVELISVWGLLSLFFFWALFIITYFLGNLAFSPETKDSKGAKSARLAFILAAIFVVPANVLIGYGWAVKFLAIFLDAFVLSFICSRAFSLLGQRILAHDDEHTPLPTESAIPSTSASSKSKKSGSKKKKRKK